MAVALNADPALCRAANGTAASDQICMAGQGAVGVAQGEGRGK